MVRAVRALLPGEDIVYLGDTARVPYGSKSQDTVIRYSLSCARFLLRYQVKMVLVACNTASAHALAALTETLPVPVIGAVEPGARTAHSASKTGHIGVIGTLGTIRSGAYERALRTLNHGATITGQACPLLVPLAEEGWIDDDIALAIARRYLAELARKDPRIDTLVLGCTHYPLMAQVIQAATREVFAQPVTLVDSASAMARTAKTLLPSDESGKVARSGQLSCHVTDASRLDELGPRFLGEPLAETFTVDL